MRTQGSIWWIVLCAVALVVVGGGCGLLIGAMMGVAVAW